jgi:hypothetical protein
MDGIPFEANPAASKISLADLAAYHPGLGRRSFMAGLNWPGGWRHRRGPGQPLIPPMLARCSCNFAGAIEFTV